MTPCHHKTETLHLSHRVDLRVSRDCHNSLLPPPPPKKNKVFVVDFLFSDIELFNVVPINRLCHRLTYLERRVNLITFGY